MRDDWIENTGGCPVDDDTLVDVMFCNNENTVEQSDPAGTWYWGDASLTHWRLHKRVEEFKGLETAYDNTCVEARYSFPETVYAPLSQIESSESKVAQIMCKMFDRNITELDVSRIVMLLKIV